MQTYLMVGAGGTGSHLLPALLPYLRTYHQGQETDYQVVIADGDVFEPKNLSRQLFPDTLVSVNKAEAMLRANDGHPIIAVSRYLGQADVRDMIQDGDIVLICADNFSIRSLIIDHVQTLPNAVVINGGNEYHDGNVQLWVRENGENATPNLRYGHPEIAFVAENDRAAMTCIQVAELPGGEQLILANQASAHGMLTALWRYHQGLWRTGWTEMTFDLQAGVTEHIDMRERRNWAQAL